MSVCLVACGKNPTATPQSASPAGNTVYIGISNSDQFQDVSSSLFNQLAKHKELKLVKEKKEANISLVIDTMVPEELNTATNNNFIILSYSIVNFATKQQTQGVGMGQRNILEPFSENVATVLAAFIQQYETPSSRKQ
jgi:hypothetical protein